MKTCYIAVHFDDKRCMENIPDIGQWENYYVYEVEDHVLARLSLTHAQVVYLPSKEVAYGWKFAGDIRDYLRVGARGVIARQVGEENLVPHKPEKFTYYITEEDRRNGVIFAKLILKAKIYRAHENMLKYVQDIYSDAYTGYVDHVYASQDETAIAELNRDMPGLVEKNKAYQAARGRIIKRMYELDLMADSVNTPEDVRGVVVTIMTRSVSTPNELLADRETSDVQRTAKS